MKLLKINALVFLTLLLCSVKESSAQCTSLDLVSDHTTLCQPALFKWVVKNAPKGSVFTWDFGNGVQQGQDTFYSYIATAGKISVSVTIKFPNNTVCTISKPNFVEVYPKPVPVYYASRTKLCNGTDTITYFDITLNSAKRSWVIDGTNYYNAQKKQTHPFSSTGTKRLSLVVEDTKGCKAIKEFDSAALIYKNVIVDFSADKTSGCITQNLTFTQSITGNGSKILSYKWSFPGGQPIQQLKENPDVIKFNAIGIYSPGLEIITNNGCRYSIIKQDYLRFGKIDSIALKISDTAICSGGIVSIENLNKNLKGTFNWDLPGASSVSTPDQYTCKAQYKNKGTYNISVVYDYNGCKVNKTLNNAIRIKNVKSDFKATDNYHCLIPHIVHFTNLSKSDEPGKMIYKWMVYSNDKLIRVSNNINDSFSVPQNGNYDIQLISTHSNGCSDTFRQNEYVKNNLIKPEFDAMYKVGCIDQFIEFNHNTQASSYKATEKFKWTFYDKDTTKILGYSNLSNPKFAFPDTGFYTIKMVADNGVGCKDSLTKRQYIEIVNPKIAFEISNPVICKNEVLMGKAKSQPSRARFTYSWYLQNKTDGTKIIASDSVLNVSIASAGEYNFKFAHEINKGCRDSIVNNYLIKVNGVSAKLDLDTFNGCAPFTVKPSFIVTENVHIDNEDNAIKYKWWANPSGNVIIKNENSINPEFTFTADGEYTINLEVSNSTNCKYNVSSQTIYAGVKAAFNVSDFLACANQEIMLTNQSSLMPSSIEWIIGRGAIIVNPFGESNNQTIVKYMNEGEHQIGLIANKLNTCYDTVYQSVKTIKVKADFIGLETEMKCAPVYAQFQSYSRHADSLKWDFGDGNKVITADSLTANIYRKNTGIKGGYSISLIAKSNEGCSDTLLKSAYQKVIGPVPNFDLINFEGCEPLHVNFANTSRDVFSNYVDYGDGSPLDAASNQHTYTIKNSGIDFQNYTPKMYAVDSLGCKALFESNKTVVVKANTKAEFTVTDSVLCQNESVKYFNKCTSYLSSDFYLNAFGINRVCLKSDSIKFIKNGNFEITQIVKNTNDCLDSSKITIRVNPNPVAKFMVNDSLCFKKVIAFTNLSNADPSTSYIWEINNSCNPVLYSSKNIAHTFENSGPAIVKLSVSDANNCQNSYTQNLSIPDPASTPAGVLKVVGINEENSVTIISNPIVYKHFLSANFYSNTTQNIHSTNTPSGEHFDYTTQYKIDTSLCFDMRITDQCGYESGMGNKHCTVFLKVKSNKAFTNQLDWTPYIGWAQIDKYNIYRKTEEQTKFTLLTTTSGSVNSYLDSGLCKLPYSYYVEAISNGLISKSNSVTNTPLFIFPPEYTDIKNVTVAANNTIEIKWQANNSSAFDKYILIKTDLENNKTYNLDLETNFYIDTDVNTDNNNYIYHIIETDRCGNKSKPGLEGKNIVLNTKSAGYKTSANWNTYKNWKNGVRFYTLQIEKEGGFKTISNIVATDSAYEHDQSLENIHGPYCYRVMAVSGNAKDTSYSNISCVVSPSTLFFPNAFSPNGDGINDKISARSLFVYNKTDLTGRNFNLEIFDRWGEKLFETHDIDEEWDGTYQGKTVQTSAYSYQLKAMGTDNRSYSLKGTITVVQ